MAHFVELDQSNIVLRGIVVGDKDCRDENGDESEAVGIAFCQSLYGPSTIWKKTSYNTRGGVHQAGGIAFRKNYAGIGFAYDEIRDAFIPPAPYPSWVLDEETCLWQAPVSQPDDGNLYAWDEDHLNWVAIPLEEP